MKCEKCCGSGRVLAEVPLVNHIAQKAGVTLVNHISRPCPDCQGNGVEDCCHGHEGQPEEEMNSGRINE